MFKGNMIQYLKIDILNNKNSNVDYPKNLATE